MNKITYSVMAFIFIVILCPVVVFADTPALRPRVEADDVRIEAIQFRGLRIWSEDDVLPLLAQADLAEGERMPEEVLEHRVDRALRYLAEEGLFSDVRSRFRDGVITFEFEEYPRIVNIEFKNNEAFETERLNDVVLLQREDPANPYKIRQARRDLENYYSQMGYSDVRINSRVEETMAGRAVIVFEIDETPQQVIDEVEYELAGVGLGRRILRRWGLGWAVPLREGDPYSQQRVQMARGAIQNWYYARGHMDVQVDVRRLSAPGEGIAVHFKIDEGPIYQLGEIKFSGNDLFEDRKLRAKIPVRSGDVFNREAFIEGLQTIEHAYRDRGYYNASVFSPDRFQLLKDSQRRIIDVEVDIQEGQPFYVERIEIYGNQRTYDKVIRREINLAAGELLDGQQLRDAQRRLRNLGFFEGVEFNVDPGTNDNTKIIRVSVEEGPTGQLQFGGGYSSSMGFVGNFEIRKDNFSLYDWDEAFTGRGQSISTNLQFGSSQDRYRISWDDPWFNDDLDKPDQPSPERPLAVGWSGFSIVDERDEGYNETRRGGSVRIGREFGDARSNKIDLEFSYRVIDVSELTRSDTDDVPTDIWSEWEATGYEDDGFRREISSIELGLHRDRRDHRLYPSEGYFLRASVEYAGEALGGNANYYRPHFDARGYLPFWGPVSWALRTNYKTMDTWKDEDDNPIPSFERFYLGGYNTVRGYEHRDIRVYGETDPEDNNRGGNSAFFSSLELRAELVENSMQFFLFGDIGKVYEDAWELESGDMYRSAGMGFRIYSPIGPMILSWARRMDETYEGADDKGEVQVDFNIGGAF
ncbi:MAG: outer membrane protein assembly factor BamA [bacterium]